MLKITLEDMQRDLLGYLRRVQAGETLIIVQADKPVAELKPASRDASDIQLRPIGLAAGEFTVPDDFDAPFDIVLHR